MEGAKKKKPKKNVNVWQKLFPKMLLNKRSKNEKKKIKIRHGKFLTIILSKDKGIFYEFAHPLKQNIAQRESKI